VHCKAWILRFGWFCIQIFVTHKSFKFRIVNELVNFCMEMKLVFISDIFAMFSPQYIFCFSYKFMVFTLLWLVLCFFVVGLLICKYNKWGHSNNNDSFDVDYCLVINCHTLLDVLSFNVTNIIVYMFVIWHHLFNTLTTSYTIS
jgi:hypothetical protein